ncbi:MAG: c-type cytochrome, partial [Verrucomicrobiae bacterium]|nr:c-type cytochrome [Verrucomicrobiae bacterium]
WKAFLGPFHPVTLHLPIGFLTIAFLLEVYAMFRPSEGLRKAMSLVLWASGISAVIATLLGLCRAAEGGYEEAALLHHQNYGIAVSVATLIVALIHNFAFRSGAIRSKAMAGLYRLLLIADLGLLTVAGHGGGNLTHGSKYLVEGAPQWIKDWVAKVEGHAPAGPEETAPVGDSAPTGSVFATVIQPAFQKKCYSCHGEEKQKGDYRMDTVEGLFKPGEAELDPIVAFKPLESYLVELITLPEDDDACMPPEGKERLTPEEIVAIIEWIWNGAKTE